MTFIHILLIICLEILDQESKVINMESEKNKLLNRTTYDEIFPFGVVKDWSDINIKKQIGQGNFGKVYQGYLHLNDVQR